MVEFDFDQEVKNIYLSEQSNMASEKCLKSLLNLIM